MALESTTNTQQWSAVDLFGVPLADIRSRELVDICVGLAFSDSSVPKLAFAIHIGGLLEVDNADFVDAMSAADVVYADGVSTQFLGRLAGATKLERSATTDIGWDVLAEFTKKAARPPRVAAIGGRPGLAREALEEMVRKGVATPVFASDGYQEDWSDVIRDLRAVEPEIIIVGMGAPREMLWITKHQRALPPALIMTCGGWFKIIVGDEPRPPVIVQRLWLEWLYRLCLHPRSLARRYVTGLLIYPGLIRRVLAKRLSEQERLAR